MSQSGAFVGVRNKNESQCEKSGAVVRMQREYESQCEKGIEKEGVLWKVKDIGENRNKYISFTIIHRGKCLYLW